MSVMEIEDDEVTATSWKLPSDSAVPLTSSLNALDVPPNEPCTQLASRPRTVSSHCQLYPVKAPNADERDDCLPMPRFQEETCISWMTLWSSSAAIMFELEPVKFSSDDP